MAKRFLNRITYSNGLWMLGLFFLLSTVMFHALTGQFQAGTQPVPSHLDYLPGCGNMVEAMRGLFSNLLVLDGCSLVFILIGAFFVQHFSSTNRIIRVRSYFPFFWYCVLAASLFPFVEQPGVYVVAILLIGACHRIFSVAEKREMNRALFDASLLLALASLMLNRLTWLLPFFWLAGAHIQSLSFRNVTASLVGFIAVYWVIGGLSFLNEDYRFFLNWWEDMRQFKLMDFSALSPMAIIYLVSIGLLFLISFGSFVQQQNQDKLATRNSLYGVLMLWFGGLGIWLTAPVSNTTFLFLLLIPSLIFYAHFFSLRDHVVTRVLFFVQLIVSLLALLYYR